MKKEVFSRYAAGEDVVVKHTYHQFTEGEIVTVRNPKKVKDGNRYVIEVEGVEGIDKIPTKLVRKRGSVKQSRS